MQYCLGPNYVESHFLKKISKSHYSKRENDLSTYCTIKACLIMSETAWKCTTVLTDRLPLDSKEHSV